MNRTCRIRNATNESVSLVAWPGLHARPELVRLTPGAEVEVSRDALRSLAERYRYMFAVGVLVSPELDAQRPAQPAHSDASWRAEKQAPGAKRRRRRRPGLIASVKTRKGVP